MFGTLTTKLQSLLSGLSKKKVLTSANIADAVKEVRHALLEADVSYPVVSLLIERVREKALGLAVIQSVDPGDQFIRVIHDELVSLMDKKGKELSLKKSPSVVMLCGLQGSGKTTTAAKLAFRLMKQGKKVLLAACDLQRPAAVLQLQQLGGEIGVPVFSLEGKGAPLEVARGALEKAEKEALDVLIVDTAGRLHIDAELMKELQAIKREINPCEVLFVANGATGQEAVKVASQFDREMSITGTILTMLDGTARAGAAISIGEVTGKPLKFEGIGEKMGDLQPFDPTSMADRILGMGDLVNLVRRAEEVMTEKETNEIKKKLKESSFTFNDYLKQMKMIKKMGSLKSLLSMMPGASSLGDLDLPEKEFIKLEAMISSMTEKEREEAVELVPTRRKRIAKGSGVPLDDVNRMIKNFGQMKKMAKDLPKMQEQMGKMGSFAPGKDKTKKLGRF